MKIKQNYHYISLQAMLEKGYDCELITHRFFKKDPYLTNQQLKLDDRITRKYFKSTFSYLNYLRKQKNAIIFANSRVPKSFLSCFFGKTTFFMSHKSDLPYKLWQKLVLKFFLKRFDYIKVSNPHEKQTLIKFGIKKKKIEVIPLVIDFQHFSKKLSLREKTLFKSSYSISPQKKVILQFSNLRDFKNPKTILLAIKELSKIRSDFVLLIVGKDLMHESGNKSINQMVKELEIENFVVQVGPVSHNDAPKYFQVSDLFVNSSFSEGQCITVYEAVAGGLPLCLSSIGSFTSVFNDSVLFHHSTDYKKLAQNMHKYLSNTSLMKDHQKKNYRILDNYSYGVVKEKLQHFFIK